MIQNDLDLTIKPLYDNALDDIKIEIDNAEKQEEEKGNE